MNQQIEVRKVKNVATVYIEKPLKQNDMELLVVDDQLFFCVGDGTTTVSELPIIDSMEILPIIRAVDHDIFQANLVGFLWKLSDPRNMRIPQLHDQLKIIVSDYYEHNPHYLG